jgi:hypothetical protein
MEPEYMRSKENGIGKEKGEIEKPALTFPNLEIERIG